MPTQICSQSIADGDDFHPCSFTNQWLRTWERLKYYDPKNDTAVAIVKMSLATMPPASTSTHSSSNIEEVHFKIATMGPWRFCWSDPETFWRCYSVEYFDPPEPMDTTTSVEKATHGALIFLAIGAIMNIFGFMLAISNNIFLTAYALVLFNSIWHIFCGMSIFLCLIVYMTNLAQEVGRKLYEKDMEDPLFGFEYGYSFICILASFLCTELTALITLLVYMANRDEKIFQRFHIHQLVQQNVMPVKVDEKTVKQLKKRSVVIEAPLARKKRGGLRRGSYMRNYSPHASNISSRCPSFNFPKAFSTDFEENSTNTIFAISRLSSSSLLHPLAANIGSQMKDSQSDTFFSPHIDDYNRRPSSPRTVNLIVPLKDTQSLDVHCLQSIREIGADSDNVSPVKNDDSAKVGKMIFYNI